MDEPFIFSLPNNDSESDEKMGQFLIGHDWLNMLHVVTKPIDEGTLVRAKICTCFKIVDNHTNNISENWRRIILRKKLKKIGTY